MTTAQGQHSVLVVGDHAEASDGLCRLVMQAGYQCDAVESADDAYRALRIGGPFVALILDAKLAAGSAGRDIANFARQIDPSLAVIHLGPQPSAGAPAASGGGADHLLATPVSLETLADALSKVSA